MNSTFSYPAGIEGRTEFGYVKFIISCSIDNLLKGASGQAVQNFNIRFGFKETKGLI